MSTNSRTWRVPIGVLRQSKAARWVAGTYFAWGVLVYFGSLVGGNAHEWWPVFLYPLCFPAGAIYEALAGLVLGTLVPAPVPNWAFTANDYLAGAWYLLVGTAWVWLVAAYIGTALKPPRSAHRHH